MAEYPLLTPVDIADVVSRIFEKKIRALLKFLKIEKPFGSVTGANVNASCMKEGGCNKNYPQKYNNNTYLDKNGRVHYRRREMGITITKRGTDRVFARVARPLGDATASSVQPQLQRDEIQNFLDGRFICPHEACWRILNFDIHVREPAVQILSVHLENMQQVVFRDNDNLESIVNRRDKKVTTLTEWFTYNIANEDGRHLTYLEFPSEFVWYADRKAWSPRKINKSSIGRLAYVHPTLELHVKH